MQSIKILIIEDNVLTLEELKIRLQDLGYENIETAVDAEEALETFYTFHPDLIVTDVNLGEGMDGIELAHTIHKTHDVPILFLTAYDDDSTLERAKTTGAYSYLFKPLQERELHIAIDLAFYKAETEKKLKEALIEGQKKQQEITELLNATHSILKTDDFKYTARQIFDALCRATGARAGYVALLSEDKQNNELLFLEDGGIPCQADPNLPMPIRGFRRIAYETGKVVYDNHYMQSEWVNYMPEHQMDLPNVLFAPLNIDGETIGIMGISHKDGGFNEDDARLAAAFGDFAAIALNNSRMVTSLKETINQLTEANTTKNKLFSLLGHDLNNQLGGILGTSEIIMESIQENDYENCAHFSQVLQGVAKTSMDLLSNVLQWARIQQGRVKFAPNSFNIIELFELVGRSLNHNLAKKNIQYIIRNKTLEGIKPLPSNDSMVNANEDIPSEEIQSEDIPSEEFVIEADWFMLEVVLRNLVSNAVKFTHNNGKVYVYAYKHKDHTIIEVEDTGVGIPIGKQATLFNLNDSSITYGTNDETGTGFGLIICKEFVELHKGHLEVESEEGKGAIFRIIL